jgi:pyridoxamine 5'-phosphate oxidase
MIIGTQHNAALIQMNKQYRDGGNLEVPNLENPLELLESWVKEAKQKGSEVPNAMTISTVSSDGKPHSRMVLLNYQNDEEIGFFTNLNSNKAVELESNNSISVVFWWSELERQVRIEGKARRMPQDLVLDYHITRPRKSQIAAWSSNQSRELQSREELSENFNFYEKKFEGKDVPVPEEWGGFLITVESVEYWSGRPNRLHERILLSKLESGWSHMRLFP